MEGNATHQMSQNEDRTYTCSVCRWTWKRYPQSPCPGVPHYIYGNWPDYLHTYTQLRRLKLKPGTGPEGCYFIRKAPYMRYLYNIHTAIRRRVPTLKQQEAIQKMRAGLIQTYTCKACGYYDSSHGKGKYSLKVRMGYCRDCWREVRHREKQASICQWADEYMRHSAGWIVLDSETTGLDSGDEVIELAIVSSSGAILFSSLIQPQDPNRPDLATHIHGITSAMLKDAPTFPQVWLTIKAILRRYRRVLVYNAAFDHRLLTVTAQRYGYKLPSAIWDCLMEEYARYHGAWNSYYQSYTWQKLSVACQHLGVPPQGSFHRATADALNALEVLRALAKQHRSLDLHLAPIQSALQQQDRSDVTDSSDHPF